MTRKAVGTLVAGALALWACQGWSTDSRAQDQRDPEQANARVTPIVELVRKVGPTVVNLYADLEIESVSFWGVGTQQAGSLGSGVIIHPSGLVVTNAHVITGNARKSRIKDVTVSYRPDWTSSKAEMKKFKAQVLGFDRNNDLALLAIQAPGPFPAAKLGKSSDLMIGETVVAVGNPLGREGSVTHGIVSATNRSLESPTGDQQFDDLIQTDAPLNSGNSGGPLFNILGELVGINEAIAGDRQFGRAEGQGLALPVDRVRDLLSNRFNAFDLLHLWLGLEDGESDGHGVLIRKVERDGPAAKAGLASGDVVVRVGTYDVVDRTSFNLSICSLDGNQLPITVVRDGKPRTVTVEPVAIDDFVHKRIGASLAVDQGHLLFGEVDRRGSAASLGIQPNDALVELDGKEVNTVQDVFEFLRKARHGDKAAVLIYRSARGRPPRKLEGELEL